MEIENLHELKRSALQKLAKKYGIKANTKNQKIIEQLTKIFTDGKENFSPVNQSTSHSDVTDDSVSSEAQTGFRTPSEKNESNISGVQLIDSISPLWDDMNGFMSEVDSSIEESAAPENEKENQNKSDAAGEIDGQKLPHKPLLESDRKSSSKKPSLKTPVNNGKTKDHSRISSPAAKITAVDKSSTIIVPKFAAAGVTLPNSTKKWSKLHEKRFDQMESIDDYQKRKKARAAKLLGTGEKKQTLGRLAQPKLKTPVSRITSRKAAFMSPASSNKSSVSRPAVSSSKNSAFKPTCVSIKNVNTNFSKASRLATPKKVNVTFAKSPKSKREPTPRSNMKTPTNKRITKPTLTPGRRSCATPQSAKKNAFDLQESLKKPITWKAHKGPLKKYADTTTKPAFETRVKNFKQAKVATRESRREAAKKGRKNTKDAAMMKRRGINC
uniref:Uncharacterized protein n=1 Tax=Ciona savignyi TaxID=51511 RepID=H2YZ41_CIOSA